MSDDAIDTAATAELDQIYAILRDQTPAQRLALADLALQQLWRYGEALQANGLNQVGNSVAWLATIAGMAIDQDEKDGSRAADVLIALREAHVRIHGTGEDQ